MYLASPPSAPGSPPVPPEERFRSSRGGQVGWTSAGIVGLFLLVLIAHATQVAFNCTLYGVYEPDGSAGGCPVLSWPTLIVLTGFAVSASAVAVGLSGSRILLPSPVGPQPDPRRS